MLRLGFEPFELSSDQHYGKSVPGIHGPFKIAELLV